MNWYDMPETTTEEIAKKEIAECNYCIHKLCDTMKQMKVPQKEWATNTMVKTYLERIEKAKLTLNN